MKRVLILTKHLLGGGAEKTLMRILPLFPKEYYKVEVKLVFDESIFDEEIPLHISRSSIFCAKTDENKNLIKEFASRIYQSYIPEKYDIEISFLEGYPTKIISCSSNQNSLKIAWIHSDFSDFHHSSNAFQSINEEAMAYQSFDKIVFCSQAAKSGFQKVFGDFVRIPHEVFYSPLNYEKFFQEVNSYITHEQTPYFCTFSRLAPEKGVERMIDGAFSLKQEGYQFKVLIFGEGILKNELEKRIKQYSIGDVVSLMGFIKNPYPYLKNCIAYVCPSKTESFGLALSEAITASVPIIACKCSGTQEILANGRYGLLVSNSSEGVLEGMEYCLQNPQNIQNLKAMVLEAKKDIPIIKIQKQLINILESSSPYSRV